MLSLSRNPPFHRPCKPHILWSVPPHPFSYAGSAAPPPSPPAEVPHIQCSQLVFLRPILTMEMPSLGCLGTHFHMLTAWAKHLQQYVVSPELKETYPPDRQSL